MEKRIFTYEALDLVTQYIHSMNEEVMTANEAEKKEKFNKLFIHILSLWVAEFTKLQMIRENQWNWPV